MIYIRNNPQLQKAIDCFELTKTEVPIRIYSFHSITPDMGLWQLTQELPFIESPELITHGLYFSDYVSSRSDIVEDIKEVTNRPVELFYEAKLPKKLEETASYNVSTTYRKPEKYDTDIMPYSADYGIYHAFLVKFGAHGK